MFEWIVIFHVVALYVATWHCKEEILYVLGVVNTDESKLPEAERDTELSRVKRKREQCLHSIAKTAAVYLVLALLLHWYADEYYTQHRHLKAERAAARAQTPLDCTLNGSAAWESLTWIQKTWTSRDDMRRASHEECAHWLDQVNMEVWPSYSTVFADLATRILVAPFLALCGALGQGVALFFSPLSWAMQSSLVLSLTVLGCAFAVGLYAAPLRDAWVRLVDGFTCEYAKWQKVRRRRSERLHLRQSSFQEVTSSLLHIRSEEQLQAERDKRIQLAPIHRYEGDTHDYCEEDELKDEEALD